MRRDILRRLAFGLALAAVHAAVLADTLTVCVADENAPLSYRVDHQMRGLDVRLAEAVAAAMNRTLKLVPFESKYDGDSSLTHEVNALLSSGVCDLASGFPLLSSDLGTPSRPTARVPDYPGAKRPPLRPWVPLGTLAPSSPYHAVALGLVVRDSARQDATLAEPGDARIGATAGTMAAMMLSLYRNGRLRPQLVSLQANEDALEQLEAGRFDATLVSLDRFDAWRIAHPSTPLRRAAYVHPLRINIGFVALAGSQAALAAASQVIEHATADGSLRRWSEEAGVTWIAPVQPAVSSPIGLAELARD